MRVHEGRDSRNSATIASYASQLAAPNYIKDYPKKVWVIFVYTQVLHVTTSHRSTHRSCTCTTSHTKASIADDVLSLGSPHNALISLVCMICRPLHNFVVTFAS